MFFIMANGKTKQDTGIDECVGVNSVSPERAGLGSVWKEREIERERKLNTISKTNNAAI